MTKQRNQPTAQQQQQQQQQLDDHDEYDTCEADHLDKYDFDLNQQKGGGGGKSKMEKRQAERGGGSTNVYSSKHVRAMEAQRKSNNRK